MKFEGLDQGQMTEETKTVGLVLAIVEGWTQCRQQKGVDSDLGRRPRGQDKPGMLWQELLYIA